MLKLKKFFILLQLKFFVQKLISGNKIICENSDFFSKIFIKSFSKLKYWKKNHTFLLKNYDFFLNFYNFFYFQKLILKVLNYFLEFFYFFEVANQKKIKIIKKISSQRHIDEFGELDGRAGYFEKKKLQKCKSNQNFYRIKNHK